MTGWIEEATGERRRGRYALDKLLHNDATLSAKVMDRDDVRIVFMLSHPAVTLPSIARLAREPDGRALAGEAALVTGCYLRRLEHLEAMSARLGSSSVFGASDRLIDDTGAVLARLTRWLALGSPLASTYRTFPYTGVDGHGDPSPSIRAGRVLGAGALHATRAETIDVPAEAMRAAADAYERLLPMLQSRHPG